MSTTASVRLLVGRTITAYDARPFNDGRGGTAHAPVITLDNGATLVFVTEETEVGSYGTLIVYHPPTK